MYVFFFFDKNTYLFQFSKYNRYNWALRIVTLAHIKQAHHESMFIMLAAVSRHFQYLFTLSSLIRAQKPSNSQTLEFEDWINGC